MLGVQVHGPLDQCAAPDPVRGERDVRAHVRIASGIEGLSAMARSASCNDAVTGRASRFVEDPRIPLDNNAAERALRGPVVGRKNHYGSRSLRGTEVAAVCYTLCETARLVGVDPRAYRLRAVYAAIGRPGTVTFPEDLLASP